MSARRIKWELPHEHSATAGAAPQAPAAEADDANILKYPDHEWVPGGWASEKSWRRHTESVDGQTEWLSEVVRRRWKTICGFFCMMLVKACVSIALAIDGEPSVWWFTLAMMAFGGLFGWFCLGSVVAHFKLANLVKGIDRDWWWKTWDACPRCGSSGEMAPYGGDPNEGHEGWDCLECGLNVPAEAHRRLFAHRLYDG